MTEPPGYVAPPAFADPADRRAPLYSPEYPQYAREAGYPVDAYGRSATDYTAWTYGGPPSAPTAHAYPSPGHKLGRATLIAVAAVLLVVGIVVAFGVVGASTTALGSGRPSAAHHLVVPTAVGDYRLLTGPTADELRSSLASAGSSFPGLGPALATARIGAYGQDGLSQPAALFIGLAGSDSAQVRSLLDQGSPGDLVKDTLHGAGVTAPVASDPGPLGGALQCGALNEFGTNLVVGVWADHDTMGLVMILNPLSLTSTALETRAFRAAAEH